MAFQSFPPSILTQPGRKGRITSPVSNEETEAPGPTEAAGWQLGGSTGQAESRLIPAQFPVLTSLCPLLSQHYPECLPL